LDASIDLRRQLLRIGAPPVTRIVFTHAHVDHFFGLDELRGIQFRAGRPVEVFAADDVLACLPKVYGHLFDKSIQKGGGILQVETHRTSNRFRVGAFELVTLPVCHGALRIQGYRWGDTAYLTDCSRIPEETWPLLDGLDTLIVGMLRKKPHPTHFNLNQAMEVVGRLNPRRTFFIHMTHDIRHEETSRELPDGVELAYDGLTIDLSPFDPTGW